MKHSLKQLLEKGKYNPEKIRIIKSKLLIR